MQIMTDERKILQAYPEAGRVIASLKEHGLSWDFTPDGRIPDLSRWIQVRPIEQFHLPMQSKKYKVAYLRNKPVPPIVVTADGVGIDGANRTSGALEAGLAIIPQFRLRIKYEEATDSQRRQLILFATAANNEHGLGMSKAANATLIRDFSKDGKTVKQLASELNVSESLVSAVLAEDRGVARLNNLGIQMEDGLRPSHVQKLGWKSRELNNAVMLKVAELTRDSHLSVGELEDLLRQLAKLTSDEDKLAAVAQAAADYGPRLRQVVRRADNFGGKLRQRGKSMLLVIEKDPGSAIELDARYVEDHLKMLDLLIVKLEEVRKEQRSAIGATSVRDREGHSPVVPTFRSGGSGS